MTKIVDQYAHRKKKYMKGNHSLFINKNLYKEIMLRTKLRNIFFSRTGLRNVKVDTLSKEIYV